MTDEERMPSLAEWLAEYRSRPEPEEVVLYRVALSRPVTSPVSGRSGIASLRIVRYDEPANPNPTGGVYLLSEDMSGTSVADTWHELLEDAFAQAEYEFHVSPEAWRRVDSEDDVRERP